MRRIILLAFAFLLLPACSASAGQVGSATVYSSSTSNAVGRAQVYRYQPSTAGALDQLSVYLDASNTARPVLALYTGTSTNATTLQRSCTVPSPPVAGWNRCSVASYTLTAGAYYWLGLLQPSGTSGSLQYREGTVAGVKSNIASPTYSAFPATWPSGGANFTGYAASLYAAPAPTPVPDARRQPRARPRLLRRRRRRRLPDGQPDADARGRWCHMELRATACRASRSPCGAPTTTRRRT
jgi:hypothetical protein